MSVFNGSRARIGIAIAALVVVVVAGSIYWHRARASRARRVAYEDMIKARLDMEIAKDAAKRAAAASGAVSAADPGAPLAAPPDAPAVAAAPAPAPAAPQAAPAARSELTWWAKTEIGRSGSLYCTFYCFGPPGFVYTGPPNGARTVEDLRNIDPQHVGTYTVAGGKATFQFPGAPAETHTLGGGMMDVAPLQPVKPLANGTTIDGRYSVLASSTFGGVHAASGGTWTFRADGTFAHEGFAGVETTAHKTGTGSGPANVAGTTAQLAAGRYRFENGALICSDANGAGSEAHPAWNVGGEQPPSYLYIDGMTFSRAYR